MSDIIIKPVGKRLSAAFFMRWLSVMLFALACHEAVAAQQGIITPTSAGGHVTAGKYDVLMSLGQSGPIGTSSSSRYKMMFGHVPATVLPPDLTAPNTNPVAVADSATLNEDTVLPNLNVLANDTDVDAGDTLSVVSTSTPGDGSVTINNDGTLTYSPDGNFNGIDSFTYTLSDGNGGSDTGIVTLTVAKVNDPLLGAVTISGTPTEGQVLTVSNTLTDVDGLGSITYTWSNGDTGTTTTLGQSDVGNAITVIASYIDGQGTAESSTSTPTVIVASASDTSVTQTISLVQGWNLVSLHTQPADMSPSSIFTGHFDVIEEMRTLQGVFNTSWPIFLNTIQQLDLAGSYWVKANAARSGIQVIGTPPSSTVINLTKGWNLIGFPSVGAQETATLFKPLSDRNAIERVIGTGEFYTFDSNALFNTLSSLKPGDGYWVKMKESEALTVTSVAAGDGQNGGRNLAKADGKTKLAELKPHLVTYPSVPAICITEIRAGGKEAPTGSLLAAYVGDELRGVQEVRFQDGKMIVPVVIQSSQPAEVRFRLWHAGLAKWFEITERVQVDSGDALGMGDTGQVLLNVTLPWSGTPELALKQNPLRLAVRHELARRFIVEQSLDLNNWEQWWQLTATGQWQEIKVPAANARKYFRVRTLE
ncbi:MAG: cadherin-like domain-containing protein [Verrucomicrobia bacterium]|nr:cadherin-like domain-containing protein [Verrucomicrobiota bacterium]MBT6790551.1 cadherin-like domain-containing protein [Verrucomicrobiota bacterium]